MGFEIPEDIKVLDDAKIAEALDAAFAEAGELAEVETLSDDQVDRMEALANFVTSAQAEVEARATAAAEREQRLAAARAALTRPEAAAAEDVETAAEETEPVAEAGEQDKDDEEFAEEAAEVEPVEEKAEEAVVASGGTSAVERAAKNAERPDAPPRPSVAITAGAEVPNKALGQTIANLDELGETFISKFQAMSPGGMRKGARQRYNVGKMTLPRTDTLVADSVDAQETFMEASREARLPGGSLTASRLKAEPSNALVAAGWCAPSETMYDLCSVITADGLYSLPEVQVRRGGIRYTQGPDLSGIDISDIGFVQTETQAEAGTEKPCLEIPCPDFIEERLDATGICIKAGLLQVSAYPELVREYIETYLTLYQHRYSLDTLTKVQTLIGAANTLTGVWDSALSLLHAIELVAEGYRQDNLLGFDSTLEVVLPHWVLPALRADLANRNGVEQSNVSDADLLAHFATRHVSPQFIRHYQDLDTSSGIAVTYPDEVEFMMYPAGSYVRGVTDVISLDAVYDSVGLSTNTYTALFAETGMLVAEMCTKGKRVNLPLGVTGKTAIANIDQHFTAGS